MGLLKKVAQAVSSPVQAVAKAAAPVVKPVTKAVEAINPITVASNTPVLNQAVGIADKATGGLVSSVEKSINTPTDFLQGQNITENIQATLKAVPAGAGFLIAGPTGAAIGNQLALSGFSKEGIANAGLSFLSGVPLTEDAKAVFGYGQDALDFLSAFKNPIRSNRAETVINDPFGVTTSEGYDTGAVKSKGPNIFFILGLGFLTFKIIKNKG